MKHLADWLARIQAPTSEKLGELIYRVIMPGKVASGFSDTIVKLEPIGGLPPRPGSTNPDSLAALRFFDTDPLSYTSVLVAIELGSILGLASDRRVEVAMELQVSVTGRPQIERHFLPYGSTLDRQARGPFPTDLRERFIDLMSRIGSLQQDDLDTLGAAVKIHYGASLLCEHDFRSAYLLVVAGLEVLSRAYGRPPINWSDWEGSARWDHVMKDLALDTRQAEAIRSELMRDRQLRLKGTFRAYVSESLPDSFWNQPWEEWETTIHLPGGTWGEPTRRERPMKSIIPNRAVLYSALGRSYDLRSGLVHRGEDLDMMKVGLKAGEPVLADEPVPYSVLRLILATLIRLELSSRSTPGELPDIRFL